MGYRIGIDVGGTFTDFLLISPDVAPRMVKVLSTPSEPSTAALSGLKEIAGSLEVSLTSFLRDLEVIVHGTTITTNAVLTRTGAPTVLLTTKGFRDILQMRKGLRDEPYNNDYPPPIPLVARRSRHEVDERVRRDGSVITELDVAEVATLAGIVSADIQAVAISFMHSHANAANERRAAACVRQLLPDRYVSVSHEILPAAGLYDRTSTTVLNAYVGPIMSRYVRQLSHRLRDAGFRGVLLIMQSNGGVAAPEAIERLPATTFLSGPASAPRAGLMHAGWVGYDRCITADMGGTSFDACLVREGAALLMTDGQVGPWRLALPLLDIHTIGAGGGSIASVEGGLLSVGPKSSGAVPGPACYGRGGKLPTVTDADLLLGYLSAEAFFGGRLKLSLESAQAAIERHVAEPLGLDSIAAAAGIYDVVCVDMAEGIREVSAKRGYDPRDFPLVIAGGAGPVHAGTIARLLGIRMVLIPRSASIFCAAGMLLADYQHDFVRSVQRKLDDLGAEDMTHRLREMRVDAYKTLLSERVAEDQMSFVASVDMRYATQWHDLTVRLPESPWAEGGREALFDAFQVRHEEVFGYVSDEPVLVTALRMKAIGEVDQAGMAAVAETQPAQGAVLKGQRRIYLGRQRGAGEADVWDGESMSPGTVVRGPAVIELATTTLVVLADDVAICDERGNFQMTALEFADEMTFSRHADIAQ